MSRTREQRKRERMKTAVMVLALMVMWTALCTLMVKAFIEEEPIDGVTYLESIQVYGGDVK